VVSSTPLRHTSVLVTVRELFGIGGSLTRRDAAAPSFSGLFLSSPRNDTPIVLMSPAAKVQIPFDATQAAPDDLMSEMALHWRKRTASLPGAAAVVTHPSSQDEVHQFLRTQVGAFLDYRNRSARQKRRRRARGGA
jgi:hypothetical protein